MKILILFGHPAFQNSYFNKQMVQGIENIENVTFHDLYETYPEMDIDIDSEQKLVKAHDCIIFQHPMYWYSAPAIFKEWQDLVLEHGWAHGSKGNALKGKLFFNAVTTGAPYEAFGQGNIQNYSLKEFLVPFSQMATLCKMIPLPPFAVHGTHLATNERITRAQHVYHKLLKLLANDQLDIKSAKNANYLNQIVKEASYAR